MVLTDSEIATLLFKKMVGKPSTLETLQAFQEPSREARPAVFQSQIWADTIPAVADPALQTATLDDNGQPLSGSTAGKTVDKVRKYVCVPLTMVAGSNGAAYESATGLTQDCIPYGYDPAGSYLYTLYKNDGTTVIPFGSGDYVLDCESGVLTFYSLADVTGISALLPPKITFYKYVGSKGASTAEQTAASIAGQAMDFTQQISFTGGDAATHDPTSDDLASVIIDDTDLTTLTSSQASMALQWGKDATNGSWRMCVFGGEIAGETNFHLQVRMGGAWVTKASYSSTS